MANILTILNNGQEIPIPALKGEQGPAGADGKPGDPGVYVGTTEPTDPSVKVWINPEGDAVEIPAGGGSAEKPWRLVKTITISEEVNTIEITTDNDGNPFELTDILMCSHNDVVASANCQLWVYLNDGGTMQNTTNSFFGTTAKSFVWESYWSGVRVMKCGSHAYDLFGSSQPIDYLRLADGDYQTINKLKLVLQGGATFTAGAIYLYGR